MLHEKADTQASTLSGGQQKMLEIARGLLLNPKLILIDEPSIGLSPLMVREVFAILQELLQHKVTLNERGKTRKITLLEAIMRKVADDCLKGNIKSVGFLLNRYYAAAAGEAVEGDLSEDDKAVLENYLRDLKSTTEGGGGEGQS